MNPMAFFRWLFRDRRDDDPDRPDWQALVDAVDLAATIYVEALYGPGRQREHVIRHSVHAQVIADSYANAGNTELRDWVDGELFALEAALAAYPDDLFGHQGAVRRFDYLLRPRLPAC